MPYPSHPSKLPKVATAASSRTQEEIEGNADIGAHGKVKAAPLNRAKRKLSSVEDQRRSVARKLDFK